MSTLTEAALLREVARVQHDKTLQSVRDLVEKIPTKQKGGRNSWDTIDRSATSFRSELIAALQRLRDEA
jgi:hypothetical protein